MPKIMLAEDDMTMLYLLKTLLRMEGYETIALNEQEDVLVAVHREQPDVILLDVHLTQGNGVDFLRAIRSDRNLDKMVVIMQSGMNLMDECRVAGADTFLLKPYMPEVLIDAIRDGLTGRKL
ncbi:MAG: response regulator [Chloroflexi bacterium]|nr:response regulator [Chloroflexota bacterium]